MSPFDRAHNIYFLLTFHSSYGPISYRFRDRRRFESKIAKFYHPSCILRPAEGVSLGTGYWRWGSKKLMWWGYRAGQRSLTISSAIWIQCTNVTDGRTDTGRQQRPRLRIASRGRQEAQLMLTTGSTRLAVSRGQQTWYCFGSIATFR